VPGQAARRQSAKNETGYAEPAEASAAILETAQQILALMSDIQILISA
jgi:hypothetical protein